MATWTNAALSSWRSLNFFSASVPAAFTSHRFPRSRLDAFRSSRDATYPGSISLTVERHEPHTSRELQNVTVRAHTPPNGKLEKWSCLYCGNFSSRLYRLPTSTRSHNASSNVFTRVFVLPNKLIIIYDGFSTRAAKRSR